MRKKKDGHISRVRHRGEELCGERGQFGTFAFPGRSVSLAAGLSEGASTVAMQVPVAKAATRELDEPVGGPSAGGARGFRQEAALDRLQ
eukprot:4414592-Heterocapsa_arctica.AAC.1